jgi:hypothetical protein
MFFSWYGGGPALKWKINMGGAKSGEKTVIDIKSLLKEGKLSTSSSGSSID